MALAAWSAFMGKLAAGAKCAQPTKVDIIQMRY